MDFTLFSEPSYVKVVFDEDRKVRNFTYSTMILNMDEEAYRNFEMMQVGQPVLAYWEEHRCHYAATVQEIHLNGLY